MAGDSKGKKSEYHVHHHLPKEVNYALLIIAVVALLFGVRAIAEDTSAVTGESFAPPKGSKLHLELEKASKNKVELSWNNQYKNTHSYLVYFSKDGEQFYALDTTRRKSYTHKADFKKKAHYYYYVTAIKGRNRVETPQSNIVLVDLDGSEVPINDQLCFDGVMNQDETDVDCGGKLCAACSDGLNCLKPSDCTSNQCMNNTCGLQNLCSETDGGKDFFVEGTTSGPTRNGEHVVRTDVCGTNHDGSRHLTEYFCNSYVDSVVHQCETDCFAGACVKAFGECTLPGIGIFGIAPVGEKMYVLRSSNEVSEVDAFCQETTLFDLVGYDAHDIVHFNDMTWVAVQDHWENTLKLLRYNKQLELEEIKIIPVVPEHFSYVSLAQWGNDVLILYKNKLYVNIVGGNVDFFWEVNDKLVDSEGMAVVEDTAYFVESGGSSLRWIDLNTMRFVNADSILLEERLQSLASRDEKLVGTAFTSDLSGTKIFFVDYP